MAFTKYVAGTVAANSGTQTIYTCPAGRVARVMGVTRINGPVGLTANGNLSPGSSNGTLYAIANLSFYGVSFQNSFPAFYVLPGDGLTLNSSGSPAEYRFAITEETVGTQGSRTITSTQGSFSRFSGTQAIFTNSSGVVAKLVGYIYGNGSASLDSIGNINVASYNGTCIIADGLGSGVSNGRPPIYVGPGETLWANTSAVDGYYYFVVVQETI
jgi:hypothetical protein